MKRLIALLLVCLIQTPLFLHAETIEKIIVIVNNDIITLSDLDDFMAKVRSGGMIDDLLVEDQNLDTLKKNKNVALNILINQKLLDSEVKKRNLDASAEAVEQEVRAIARRHNYTVDQLLQVVKQKGTNPAEYRDFIKKRLERQSLIQMTVSSKVKISEEEVSEYYLKNYPQTKETVFEYTVAHILFSPKKDGKDGALARADKVLKKITSNEYSFEELAEQYSDDPGFAAGGLLGTFKAGELVKEMEAAIKKLDVGNTSPVIETKFGFHILKLLKRKLITNPAFEKEKERIQAKLAEVAFKKHFNDWLKMQRDSSFIHMNGL
jgi:peptidyl-prolyl cis-trans isomerase SurA